MRTIKRKQQKKVMREMRSKENDLKIVKELIEKLVETRDGLEAIASNEIPKSIFGETVDEDFVITKGIFEICKEAEKALVTVKGLIEEFKEQEWLEFEIEDSKVEIKSLDTGGFTNIKNMDIINRSIGEIGIRAELFTLLMDEMMMVEKSLKSLHPKFVSLSMLDKVEKAYKVITIGYAGELLEVLKNTNIVNDGVKIEEVMRDIESEYATLKHEVKDIKDKVVKHNRNVIEDEELDKELNEIDTKILKLYNKIKTVYDLIVKVREINIEFNVLGKALKEDKVNDEFLISLTSIKTMEDLKEWYEENEGVDYGKQ